MSLKKLLILKSIFLYNILISQNVFADSQNINEILKEIKKDIKTLEKAVYSVSIEGEGQIEVDFQPPNLRSDFQKPF